MFEKIERIKYKKIFIGILISLGVLLASGIIFTLITSFNEISQAWNLIISNHDDSLKHELKNNIVFSNTAKVGFEIFKSLFIVVFIVYWLSLAGYMYNNVKKDGLNERIWFLVFVGFNLVGVALYYIVRLFSAKCSECGRHQFRGSYCNNCGNKLKAVCSCGNTEKLGSGYCSKCGNRL